MSGLVHSSGDPLDRQPGLNGGHLRWAKNGVQRNNGKAVVRATEIVNAATLADLAMNATAQVTMSEIHWSKEFPDYAGRFRRIGDAQAMHAARKVAEMGW